MLVTHDPLQTSGAALRSSACAHSNCRANIRRPLKERILTQTAHSAHHRDLRIFQSAFGPRADALRKIDFYLTTAGAFRTPALIDTLLEVGCDHVLFSVDYPYETMQEQSDWFESVPISEGDRLKIGRTNAQQLLRLES